MNTIYRTKLFTKKRIGVRFHPDILASENDLNKLGEVRERINKDKAPYIEYKSLPFTRRAWIRKLNTAMVATSLTIGASSLTFAPYLINEYGPFPLVISFSVAVSGIIVGSEATKTIQDYGPVKSFPVFLLFSSTLAFPIVTMLTSYPDVATKVISLSGLTLLGGSFIAMHGPGFDDKVSMILAPLVFSMAFFGYLIPPVADFNLLGFLFVVASPLLSVGTWAVFQRNMKLAKWNDNLENLNMRFTNALGLMFVFPCLLFTILSLAAYYEAEKKDAID